MSVLTKKVEDLTMLYLSKKDSTWNTPSDLAAEYIKVYEEIKQYDYNIPATDSPVFSF